MAAPVSEKLPLVVLTTAYFPPVEYFALMRSAEKVLIERCESYQKQSYRNRCHIYAAGGSGSLNVPVIRGTSHLPISEIQVDYSTPWIVQHERAIFSAYNNSPFFEYYKDDIYEVLESRHELLIDLNDAILRLFMRLIGIRTPVEYTAEYLRSYPQGDYREAIHPKRPSTVLHDIKKEKTYFQVFSDKYGFIPNLSILDLLCAEGPESISFL